MRIAVGQLDIVWEDKAQNLKKVNIMIAEAKSGDAEMILFPEMSLTGFSMNIHKTWEEGSSTLNAISEIAREQGIAVGIGWVKRNGEKAENHYSIINSNGKILLDYTKIHPFSFAGEDQYFAAGNTLAFCELKGRKISAVICYDLRFPELFQIMSYQADIILVPANWPESRREHWNTLLRARAIECQSYIIGINCVGNMGTLAYSGDSIAIAPDGTLLGTMKKIEGLLYIDIPNNVKMYRENFPVKKDRKELLYTSMYKTNEKKV